MIFCALTLGCKVNQYETQAIESILISRGHVRREAGQGCDVCIINTCAVTAESARKSRQAVRRMKRLEPFSLIAVCGCLSQLEPSAAAKLGADIVGGSGDRSQFADDIERLAQQNAEYEENRNEQFTLHHGSGDRRQESENSVLFSTLYSHTDNRVFEDLPPGGSPGRTRALLKIQDGCDNYCAYCVIPYARGRSRSLPIPRIADYAAKLDSGGFREIIITGIEISSYGKDLPDGATLTDVVRAICAAAPNARVRLGSLDPSVVTTAFCQELSTLPAMCNHFHLSLQSGCDETLLRMGRKYGAEAVLEMISSLRQWFPDCGVTADLITGFPGETEDEFRQTLDFIKTAAFSDMHIFPFSPRSVTRAAAMPGQVGKSIRLERARTASALAADMALAFRIGQVGKIVDVLFERERGGCLSGHSGNYIEISVREGGAKNAVCPVQITGIADGIVTGEIS